MKIEKLSYEDLLKYCLTLEESGKAKGWQKLERSEISHDRKRLVSYFTYKVSMGKKDYILEYLVKYTVNGNMSIFTEVRKEVIDVNLKKL